MEPAPHPAEELFRECYAAFNAGNWDGAIRGLAADVEWPEQLTGGMLHGPAAVKAYWERLSRKLHHAYDILRIEPLPDGGAILSLLQTVRGRNGVLISQGLVRHAYSFKDGLVRRMRIVL